MSKLRYGIIEANRRCQLRCQGCYMVRRHALGGGEMTLHQAVHVLDLSRDFIGEELESMDILGGEPLLWTNLQKYIQILLDRGIKPWIFTNMLAISSEMAKWLFERGVFITGKLNIGNPSDPEQVTIQSELVGGNTTTVHKMFTAIEIFLQAGYKFPMFHLENLIRKKNLQFVPDYVRFCQARGIGVDVEVMACGEGLGNGYFNIAPNPRELALLAMNLMAEMGMEESQLLMPHFFSSCRFFDDGLYFAMDGSIRACSNSTVKLADISDPDSIAKAWNSPLLCNRRGLNRNNIGEPCHSCDRFDCCRGGCRATVEGTGDPCGGYTLCPLPHLK